MKANASNRMLFLGLVAILTLPSEASSQASSHGFTIGMYSAGLASVEELKSMATGSASNWEACNTLHVYESFYNESFWFGFLDSVALANQQSGGNLKVLITTRVSEIDGNGDDKFQQNELDQFNSLLGEYVEAHPTLIAGFYLADEPDLNGAADALVRHPKTLPALYSLLKAGYPTFQSYITVTDYCSDYGPFSNTCDVLTIDCYFYPWESLKALRMRLTQARRQLPTTKKIHALLVLGEEMKPVDTYTSEAVASHGLTHSAIRAVKDVPVDGIWFYAWRVGGNHADDAASFWSNPNFRYDEILETEIHDYDELITAFSSTNHQDSKIYVTDLLQNELPSAQTERLALVSKYVTAVAAGDVLGQEGPDLSYLTGCSLPFPESGNDSVFQYGAGKSNGDGDHELLTAVADPSSAPASIYFDESCMNPLSTLLTTTLGRVSAMTSGDFDGDGDSEIATAIFRDNLYYLYVADDTTIAQHIICNGGSYYRITAMTSGDFYGLGRDCIVVAFADATNTDTQIYICDIFKNPTIYPDSLYATRSGQYVTALAAGRLTTPHRDFLVTAFSNPTRNNTQIYLTDPAAPPSNPLRGYNSTTQYYSGNYYHVTALAAGNFKNGAYSQLATAFSNATFNDTKIYVTHLDSPSNPRYSYSLTTEYYSGSYDHVTSMASASFRESQISAHGAPYRTTQRSKPISAKSDVLVSSLTSYPNPFNPTTTLTFQINQPSVVGLHVYSILGERVATLLESQLGPGTHTVPFDPKGLPSGSYFVRLTANERTHTVRVLLVK